MVGFLRRPMHSAGSPHPAATRTAAARPSAALAADAIVWAARRLSGVTDNSL